MMVITAFRSLMMVVIVSTLFSAYAMAEQDYIATVKGMQGKASIERGSLEISANEGDKIYEGDIVETSRSGNIALLFIDGTQFSIGPSSSMVINRYLFVPKKKSYAFKIRLNRGSAIYTSGRMAKLSPESVEVQTPQATIGVRGTKFLVEVN